MKLTYHHDKEAYVLECKFEERQHAKNAGFWWHSIVPNKWATRKPEDAAKLLPYADDETKAILQAVTDERQRNLELSRASSLDIEIPCPDGLEYLPYQKAGIAFAQDKYAVLFGDEMGLGKTIQGIGFINTHPDIKSALIICPASLKLNWQHELERWLTRPLSIAIADTKTGVPDADIVITNYDVLHRINFNDFNWDLVLLDEAHYIKNEKTLRSKHIKGQRNRKDRKEWDIDPIQCRCRLALTGTPIPSRTREAWNILNWLDPDSWPSYWDYVKRYSAARKGAYGWEVDGASNLEELQDRLRSTIMVRRKKVDVLTELPPKRRAVVVIPGNGASEIIAREKAAYEAHRQALEEARADKDLAKAAGDEPRYKQAVERLRSIQGLTFSTMAKVRAELAEAKAPHVADHVADIMDGTDDDYKVIVFAHHKKVVEILESALAAYNPVKITGDTSMVARQEAVDRFQNDPNVRVFIGNIQAAGVGLTLTASAHVIFAELDWVPANVMQAEDRAHRIGQLSSVLVEHLVFDGSLDARMAKIIVAKQAVIDKALDTPYTLQETATPDEEPTEQPQKSAEKSTPLTDEQVAAVHEALRILAGNDQDHAAQQNGIGFNRYDGRIGHSLTDAPALSQAQAQLGLKLVRKYRKQLPESITTTIGV